MLDNAAVPPSDFRSREDDVERRRSLGIYYTPRSAAALLAKWAIRHKEDTILEPSIGGCTILEAAAERLRSLGCQEPRGQIHGFDVDDAAFSYLQRLFGTYDRQHFRLQDFLRVAKGSLRVKTVIANPPFVSYHRMNDGQRAVVREWRKLHTPDFPMTASLWAYFLAHSLTFLENGGRLAFVLPFSATSSDYAKPIRSLLGARFSTLAIYKVTEHLFIQAGAEERTVVMLADGFIGNAGGRCSLTERSVPSLQALECLLSEHANSASAEHPTADILPTQAAEGSIHSLLSKGTLGALGDIVYVRIGEVVGDTGYFVKTRQEWERLGIPSVCLQPIITRTRQVPGIRVTRNQVRNSHSSIPLMLTLDSSAVPKPVRHYLDRYPAQQISRNITFGKRSPWYAVSYDTEASAFIGAMSHESPKIVWNSAAISCANGFYKLFTKAPCRWRALLAGVGHTTIFKLSAEIQARVRGAGALKLEPSDIRKLLVPTEPPALHPGAAVRLLSTLDGLVRRGQFDTAKDVADDTFYISTGLLTFSQLNRLRLLLLDLNSKRLKGKRHDP